MHVNRLAALAAAALAGLGLAAAAIPAAAVQAAQPAVVSAVPSTATPNVNDGVVYAIGESGSTVVLGGSFTSVSPPGASSPTVAVPHLVAFAASSGALISNFAPSDVNSTVNAIIPGPTSGTVYVGGSFTKIDGVSSRLALISTTTGQVVPGWTSPSIGGGAVNSLVLSGGQLFVGGYFTSVGGKSRVGLAVLNPTTGALSSYPTPDFSGHHNFDRLCTPGPGVTCASASTGVKSMDVNPAGTRLVAIGNFTTVAGLPRDQIALLDLSASAAAVDASWATDAYTAECNGASFDTYMRDVQFSPDGSYFVVADTGGGAGGKNSDGTQTSCDAAARYETTATGADVRPSWIDYTGNDSFLSVAITGPVVYIGGHQRWVNNSTGSDKAGEGAVPRPGLVAFDPINGMPLAWNPGRNPRGAGAYALLATSDGLYVGSDTDYIGVGSHRYTRRKIAMFPLAGGSTLAANESGALPGTVFLLGSGTSTSTARAVPWNGSSDPGSPSVLTAVDWSTARGAFEVNNRVYYGDADGNFYERSFDGKTFGPAVAIDPYDDPTWDGVDTGSGQTYQGAKSAFYAELPSLTSMFYSGGRVYYTRTGSSHLFWRWFEPDSGVVGADEFTTTDALDWSHVAGAFLSGSTLYFADPTSLMKVAFTGGQPTGSESVADDSMDWSSAGAFVSSSSSTTTLTVAPTGTVKQHQPLTLTADVALESDSSVHPAGTVRFKDGTKTLGTAAVDTVTGDATLSTSHAPPSAPGGAVLTAFFTPADGSPQTSTSAPVRLTINPVATAPVISGKVRVGNAAHCVEPLSAGETIRYAWRLGSKRVATTQSYRIPASALHRRLGCRATVSMGSGPASAASSRRHTIGRGAALRTRVRPRLSGPHRVGLRESVSHGRWSPRATSYSYEWYVGRKKISHATRSSVVLTRADATAVISCRVTAHRRGYAAGSATTRRVRVSG